MNTTGRTAAVLVVGVQGVMRGAATSVSIWHSKAELTAVSIVLHTLVGAVLPGGVEYQNVHNKVQATLDQCTILAIDFVCPFYAVQVPVCPVDVVTVLGKSKRMRKIISNDLSVLAC